MVNNMIKSGDYVIVTEHNYDKLKRYAHTRIWQDGVQYGSIYRVVASPLEHSELSYYLLDLATESLEDFINTQPDIDPDRIKIGLSWSHTIYWDEYNQRSKAVQSDDFKLVYLMPQSLMTIE